MADLASPGGWRLVERPVVPGAKIAVSEHQPRPPRPRLALLSEPARRSILTAVNSHSVQDGLEVGGVLLGRVGKGGTLEVERALEASAARGRYHVGLDLTRTGGRLDDLVLLGDWHVHLGETGPSDQDLRSWRGCAARARAETGAPVFLGLIVRAKRWGNHPSIRAYATDWRGRTRAFDL